MNEERLTEIEIKLAYQEKTIKDLDGVICDQQKEIWKQRDKNQPKSPVKNQPLVTKSAPVRVRFKPDSKGRVFRHEPKPA